LLKSRNLHPLLGNDYLFIHYGFEPIIILIEPFLYKHNFHEKLNSSCLQVYKVHQVILA